jgi:hypothetical protein
LFLLLLFFTRDLVCRAISRQTTLFGDAHHREPSFKDTDDAPPFP